MSAIVPQSSAPVSGFDSFNFHGYDVKIFVDDRGHWVFPAQLCVAMGLSVDAQRRSIERKRWSETWKTVMVFQLPGDTQAREHFLLHQRRLPMWLGSIVTSRIKDEAVRARVEEHQDEFADVLADYVYEGGALNPRADLGQLQALNTRILEQAQQIRELAPDAHAYRVLAGSGIAYDMKTAADILRADPNIDIGRTRLFARLREMGFLNTKNEPLMKKGQYVVSGANEIVVKDNPTYYRDRITGEIRKGRAKTLLTYKGLRLMHDDLGGTQPLMITESEIIR